MILEYNILWFENNNAFYELAKKNIEEYLTNLGFSPAFTYYKDDRQLEGLLERKDLDIILMDQNLRFNVKSDDIINILRNSEVYTDVVLYSQNRDFEDEIRKNLDGVFFTDREHLEEKAKHVIDMTLRRDLDMSNIRGTFIAETIYAASQMEELITKILKLSKKKTPFFVEQMQDENFSDFLKYKIIKHYLAEQIKTTKIELASQGRNPDPGLSDRQKKLEKLDSDFNNFKEDIIEFRNQLAHGKKCPDKRNVLIMKTKNNRNLHEQSFDSEYCKNKRNLFIVYSKLLQDISSIV